MSTYLTLSTDLGCISNPCCPEKILNPPTLPLDKLNAMSIVKPAVIASRPTSSSSKLEKPVGGSKLALTTIGVAARVLSSPSFPPACGGAGSTYPMALFHRAPVHPSFLIDNSGRGNCAAYALMSQLNQQNIRKADGSIYKESDQITIRTLAKDFLLSEPVLARLLAANLEEENTESAWLASIVGSLQDAKVAHVLKDLSSYGIPHAEFLKALTKGQTRNAHDPLTVEEKRLLIRYFAQYIAIDMVWLDKGFFRTISECLNRQVAIVRLDDTGTPYIEERFPLGSLSELSTLFVYYNGSRGAGGGYHFESLDLSRNDIVRAMIKSDQEQHLDDFITSCNRDYKIIERSREENIAGLRRLMDNLKLYYPQGYRAVLVTLLSLHADSGIIPNPDINLTDDQLLLLANPAHLFVKEELEALIT